MSAQPESKVSRSIIGMIRAGGGYAVKFHGGPMTEAGTPDILACIPVPAHTEDGRIGLFVGIETKMPSQRKNVSPIQKYRHAQIQASGGVAIVVTSVQEARAALEALGWVRVPGPPVHVSDDN